jgi:hypothetical protein
MRQATVPKLILLALTGFLLSILTFFFGAPFLRVLRRTYGRSVYWILGIVFSLVASSLWFLVASFWILIGVYDEVERAGKGLWTAVILSVSLSGGFGGLVAVSLLKAKGFETREQIVGLVGELIDMAREQIGLFVKLNANTSSAPAIDPAVLLDQLPSLVIMVMLFSLANAILFERKVCEWFRLPKLSLNHQDPKKLLEFKVPDGFIWVALLALLFFTYSFNIKELEILALNVVNVSAVLYFFQGLAVMEAYLAFVKAGFFMRFLTYFIIVGQLFILLSIVGLVDFWAGFRARIEKLKSRIENR